MGIISIWTSRFYFLLGDLPSVVLVFYQFKERDTLIGFWSPAVERYRVHHQQEGYPSTSMVKFNLSGKKKNINGRG